MIPWTVVRQVPLSMGFSRQEYWSRVPFPFPVVVDVSIEMSFLGFVGRRCDPGIPRVQVTELTHKGKSRKITVIFWRAN